MQLAVVDLKHSGDIKITVLAVQLDTHHHIALEHLHQFHTVMFFWVLPYVVRVLDHFGNQREITNLVGVAFLDMDLQADGSENRPAGESLPSGSIEFLPVCPNLYKIVWNSSHLFYFHSFTLQVASYCTSLRKATAFPMIRTLFMSSPV